MYIYIFKYMYIYIYIHIAVGVAFLIFPNGSGNANNFSTDLSRGVLFKMLFVLGMFAPSHINVYIKRFQSYSNKTFELFLGSVALMRIIVSFFVNLIWHLHPHCGCHFKTNFPISKSISQ